MFRLCERPVAIAMPTAVAFAAELCDRASMRLLLRKMEE
jgi:hypothetical protein